MTKYKRIRKPHPINGLIDYEFEGKAVGIGVNELNTHLWHDLENVEEIIESIKEEVEEETSTDILLKILPHHTNEKLLEILIRTHDKHKDTPEYNDIISGVRTEIIIRMGEAE